MKLFYQVRKRAENFCIIVIIIIKEIFSLFEGRKRDYESRKNSLNRRLFMHRQFKAYQKKSLDEIDYSSQSDENYNSINKENDQYFENQKFRDLMRCLKSCNVDSNDEESKTNCFNKCA